MAFIDLDQFLYAHHVRLFEGVIQNSEAYPGTLLTVENNCVEGEMTREDPFEDSGVARAPWPCTTRPNILKHSQRLKNILIPLNSFESLNHKPVVLCSMEESAIGWPSSTWMSFCMLKDPSRCTTSLMAQVLRPYTLNP